MHALKSHSHLPLTFKYNNKELNIDMTERRPSRSDEHLAVEEEARMEAEVREYFDDMNPKRHTKPSRSDPPDSLLHVLDNPDAPILELRKFQDLEAHSQSQVGIYFDCICTPKY